MVSLQVLADANIPRVEEAFGQFGPVRTKPGRDIAKSDVEWADVLLVRSVTPVGPGLLEGTSVRFVGSATIGTDHVDEAYLQARDIPFAHAPGSNADSVADYVVVVLLTLARRRRESLRSKTVGIVGCGNIGGRLARRLSALGMEVLNNDPPRARSAEQAGRSHDFVSLDTVLDEADILTVHVPLKDEGPDPTRALVDASVLNRMNAGSWVVNTSRGPVVDGDALRAARDRGPVGAAVLDVWEHEPIPDPALVRTVDVATPHIAGYAYDGKVRGTAMLYEALCEEVGAEPVWEGTGTIQPESKDELQCSPPDPRLPMTEWCEHLARQAYDPRPDDAALRALPTTSKTARADAFTRFRKNYRRRRELRQHSVPRATVPTSYIRAVGTGLTVQLR